MEIKGEKIDSSKKYNALFSSKGINRKDKNGKGNNKNKQNKINENKEIEVRANDDLEKKQKALEYALDIRKFEIDLYWKRATYFWTFIGATFAGFFLLISRKELVEKISIDGVILLALCSLGFIFTYCWFLVNRGSKFWQKNWEHHVDMLEDEIIGPLYKTSINMQSAKFWSLHKEYPYSVSKINQMLSIFLVFIWILFGAWVSAYFELFIKEKLYTWILIGTTLLFTLIFTFKGKSESDLQGEKEKEEFFVKRRKFLK